MTPAAHDAEREAREAVVSTLTRCHDCIEYEVVCGPAHEAVLDAYAAAVRRAERERIAGIVEGMRKPHELTHSWAACLRGEDSCECGAIQDERANRIHNAALDALLAKLREAK